MDNKNIELINQIRLMEFYKRAMEICEDLIINYHKFRTNRLENGFKNACDKLYNTESYSNKIAKSKIIFSETYLGNKDNFMHEKIYTLRNEYIENELRKNQTSAVSEYIFLNTLGILTGNDAILGMKNLSNLYLECAHKIVQIRKDNKKVKKEVSPKGHAWNINGNKEENIKNAILYLDTRVKNGVYTTLSEQESNDLIESFIDISEMSSQYYSTSTINRILSINKNYRTIRDYNKKDSFIDNKILETICSMGINVFDTITLRLLSDNKDSNFKLLTDTIGYNNIFNKYEKAYELYNKYFNSLSSREKDDIRIRFSGNSFDNYRNLFDLDEFHILTSDELRNKINNHISTKVINKHDRFTSIYFSDEICKILDRCTSMMDNNELIELYRELCNKERQDYLFNKTRSTDSKIDNDYDSRLMNLQKEFAILISTRISTMSYDDYLESSDQTIKKKEELLYMVVRDYLKEKVLFPTVYGESALHIENDVSLVDMEQAKADACRRFYKLNKLKQTAAKVNGKWNLCMSIINKNILTQEDLDTLNKLFR